MHIYRVIFVKLDIINLEMDLLEVDETRHFIYCRDPRTHHDISFSSIYSSTKFTDDCF